ncbi:MAG: tRNA preQ1(34) S-adenosylmethionine ribosyltransferase-isomerase QueA [Thermoanaerobaculia bacterium]|jgi:S-adenosylmethionine:tRNA ribosyltransferase-isomerase|nr:tRNA preQ1(34) S-adenosylmethionine ribosyltransferase-isomerase QueA [Thermoanaerobaculia bacterium]MBP9822697.1 tRNA preQ1(34) S-adenosylmethionine ribosyltransferase-isomerase QueA [Thermoanaerobaculia bacterium]
MLVGDFDFELPASAIAQEAAPRGSSRLLCLDAAGAARHAGIGDLPSILGPGDLLIANDTRVIPARLFARRTAREGSEAGEGARVELLLIEKLGPRRWHCLAKPGRKARVGTRLRLSAEVSGLVVAKEEDGRHTVDFSLEIEPHLETLGHVPLPPYIARADRPEDRARYQTVWAREPGAIAAPTAGLHFSEQLLQRLDTRGVERAFVTLHVGIGTFKPVTAELVHEHRMERERYEIPPATAAAIARARREGRRIVAVGTTVVRALESAALAEAPAAAAPASNAAAAAGNVPAGAGTTAIFITPGFRFQVVDLLLTNFHLPRSTLLMLVSAFAGRERVLAAYAEAIAQGYRFYSYGDAMLVERQPPP